jgi:hypothetical protein
MENPTLTPVLLPTAGGNRVDASQKSLPEFPIIQALT